jgi:hypothetical protein
MALEQLQFLEQQIGQLDQEMASLLSQATVPPIPIVAVSRTSGNTCLRGI